MSKKIAALLFVCLCLLPLQASGGKGNEKKISDLAKARFELAEKLYGRLLRQLEARTGVTVSEICQMSVHLLNAQRDLDSNRQNQIAAYQAHFERMVRLEKTIKPLFEKGRAAESSYSLVQLHRLEAELWLEKAKSKMPK